MGQRIVGDGYGKLVGGQRHDHGPHAKAGGERLFYARGGHGRLHPGAV